MKFILVLFTCLCVLKVATSTPERKCYACVSSDKEQKCGDPFDKTKHTLDTCDDPKDVCFKERLHTTKTIGDNVQRGCVYKDYCKDLEKKSLFCAVCEGEGCNSSVMLVPSFIILTSFLIRYLL